MSAPSSGGTAKRHFVVIGSGKVAFCTSDVMAIEAGEFDQHQQDWRTFVVLRDNARVGIALWFKEAVEWLARIKGAEVQDGLS